ncbi:TetR/AcrR family transcriptional regulator [Mesorhizobium sp. M7A.F.Ca.CA.001.09.2.1]|uniref:TetR/AcrR family transcriptional regulator n=1 Tax=Mesorhizobium TaxID=68287 RepID=UPI00040917B7|nr:MULTISPECIES: TetR/AcrR family transcriptional regulator [Mesorhizobium]RUY23853.1 TetR/AcrR family transcriptional regulator [Mesorhizobium sp. M7A.F.Ca.CA.001.13.2.1]RUZ83117.1 TetR/AcrR family transcriptional regulator [Mesorhizobium sp. M7A.F.Ca.US.003.02.2.1]AMX96762.1 TetR family transcriptional regulator [Mesorhizobium ciceri]AMY01777.1 TetR family transcriptional regulator [Mesorhizobium ciceri biovar biserrulae]ARP64107.1 TetR family transcriptional regulator [Mesorhizobium sp. WSM
MKIDGETRSARKDREIIEAATAAFIAKGYDGTSMEEIATKAGASKQTVYKHFTDKETLFGEVVESTASQTNDVVESVTMLLSEAKFMEGGLQQLARRMTTTLMDEELLKLRRLIIANADRMPQLGRSWYEKGFERMLASVASCFQKLTSRGLLQTSDPRLAASHLFGMLLWIPMNEAMFTGSNPRSKADLERHADASVEAFLAAYGARPK